MNRALVKRLSVATDFFPFPGGRFRKNGRGSGEEFRDQYLVPGLQEAKRLGGVLSVSLDGVMGYPSSFLEEAFGGLVRERGFSKSELNKHLIIEANERHLSIYRELALDYITEADRIRQRAIA